MVLDLGKLDPHCDDFEMTMRTCVAKRPAPEDPAAFYNTLLMKEFTKGTDFPLLEEKYQDAFRNVVERATRLDYTAMNWTSDQLVKFCPMLARCSHLAVLDLGNNKICAHGIAELCQSLPSLKELSRLALGRNLLRNRGVELLSQVLSRCGNLRELDLRHNEIGKPGVDRLAGCTLPPYLRWLDLRGNDIKPGQTSADRIIAAWKRNGKPPDALLLSMPGV